MSDQEMLFMRNGTEEVNVSDQDDIWDDTALIKAYDVAVKAVKDKIAQRLECSDLVSKDKTNDKKLSNKNGFSKGKRLEWQVGGACRAVYSEDGEVYEATIQSINANTNSCVVKYIGYENEEEIPISHLMISEGPEARAIQENESSYGIREGGMKFRSSHRKAHPISHLNKERMQKKNVESKRPYSKENITNFGSQFPPLHQPSYFGNASPNTSFPHMPATLPPPPPLSVTSNLPLGDSEALSAMLMSWYMSGFHTGYYQGLQQAKQMNGIAKQTP